MNKIVLTGRLTYNLELRATVSGKEFCEFTLAIRRDEKTTDFIPCVIWGASASTLCKYCNKGDLIGVEGSLQSNSYEKDGKKITRYSVLTNRIEFLNLKNTKKEEKVEEQEDNYDINLELTDDELPF